MQQMVPAAHLNERLKRILPRIGFKASEIEKATKAPYLTLDLGVATPATEEDYAAIQMFDEMGLTRTPFPEFRFCTIRELVDSKRKYSCSGFVRRTEAKIICVSHSDIIPVFVVTAMTPNFSEKGMIDCNASLYRLADLKDVTERFNTFAPKNGATVIAQREIADKLGTDDPEAIKVKFQQMSTAQRAKHMEGLKKEASQIEEELSFLRSMKDRLEIETEFNNPLPASLESPKDQVSALIAADWRMVAALCYEYIAPHNFVAKVTPGTQGKSVEWTQAREHYTVIHRKHAANNKGVANGATVKHTHAATRMAHTRRAHTRLLTASRYTYMKGQRVPVKSSWCGPKEWKDTAGHIYKILVPVKP